ncbi:Uncharacterised protein [Pannonibacter phragmitetus]|uniref:Uncharacterized protein n=1 Tax=Pannonibacter phragmitetus TaxID=121719 RepID=A0A378ZQV1_9HYPH|nr:hypothetical protein [Pannonibacter phragmitetus]SUA99527.1 Uncharacterised protein [Pannonibacter phragmitetus]
MISYLVDAVLLIALAITSFKMVTMYRELRRLGSYHEDYQRIFDQTALALDGIEVSVKELNVRGAQVLNALGARMDDARELIAEIDALTREAKRQQAVLKSELKQLSTEVAMRAKAGHIEPPASDMGSTVAETVLRNTASPVSEPQEPAAPTEMKVHRLDDLATGPFRSVSIHRKDDLT